MESQGIKDQAKDLVSNAGDYLETLYKVNLLKVTGKAVKTGSAIITSVVMVVLTVMVLLFGSIALAFWLGNMVESRVGGFLIVAGIYFVLLLFIMMTKKSVVIPFLRNLLTRKIYEA